MRIKEIHFELFQRFLLRVFCGEANALFIRSTAFSSDFRIEQHFRPIRILDAPTRQARRLDGFELEAL
jgi:hypothetical protein